MDSVVNITLNLSRKKNCFLSRANLKEYEVILQRVGLDRLSHEEVKTLRVYARHHYGMGKYWRPSKLRQYPGHKGPPTSVKSRDEINPAMAKEVFQLFDVSVLSNITLHKKQGDFFDIDCAWNLTYVSEAN